MNVTDVQLVEKYIALRDHVTARKAAHTEELAPYTAGMGVIEGEFLRRLIERGADNTKTEAGTAYKTTLLNIKVIDQEAFLNFAASDSGIDLEYTVHPVKD